MADDTLFDKFYREVKSIEQKDAQLTSDQQIARLLRPGSMYFNLNPFEVLQIDPETPVDEIKKQYRKFSILVHPDKNPGDKERAQQAFDILKKAMEMVENEAKVQQCKSVIEEATARTDLAVQEKRKQLKKAGKTPIVDEDDPEKYKRAVWVLTMKLFAERERKRKQMEERDNEDRKRQKEEEQATVERKKMEEEFQKNFEESREERVSSWKTFQTKADKKGKYRKGGFRPPKPKPEAR